ncbi:MAG: GTP-binding protein, partial [Clostridia bacterium]|nr:GTP-binding protein [Clostridia bacterium]
DHDHEHCCHHDHDEHHHEHHHHEHGDDCKCGCHDHHHHDHHADEVFVSCGAETAAKYTEDKIKEILESLNDSEKYGMVLRAKGIVDSSDSNGWIHFDYVPGECDVRRGSAAVIGRICIIGSGIDEQAIRELFGI